jgi:pimeloyl-ACP methyl ester carboxylesterase
VTKPAGPSYGDGIPAPERVALKAVASLVDRFPGLPCLSDIDQVALFRELGLSPDQSRYVASLAKIGGIRDHVDVGDSVLAPPERCPIPWRPTVLTPVFYGRQIAEPDACLPTVTRIYYPSLDGAVQNAPLLERCGGYPLILFLHGHCATEDNHVFRWERTLAQLARSGFVVAAPHLSLGSGPQQQQPFEMALAVLRWMRRQWTGRSVLLPPPATGICGHSFGGMVACRVAVTQPVQAFAALSSAWHEWPTFGPAPLPLFQLAVPSLHMFATETLIPEVLSDADFAKIAAPRHKVILEGGEHFVYIQGQGGGCSPQVAPCHLLAAVAADLLAGFFARYLPPSERVVVGPGSSIPLSLVPPDVDLTFEQQFFAGGHLTGLKGLPFSEGCRIVSSWALQNSAGERVLP